MKSNSLYPKVTITDENGKVLAEGICTSYSISIDRSGMGRIKAEGLDYNKVPKINVVQVPAGIEFIPLNISIDDLGAEKPDCAHQWLPYQGLIDRYDYCKLCGDKK